MLICDAAASLLKSAEKLYDSKEAERIVMIIFNDLFQIYQIKSKQEDSRLSPLVLNTIKQRIENHEPVQYITELAYFYKSSFFVNPHVLIPRPETEELVDYIIQNFDNNSNLKVLDIGTGSGCIAISIQLLKDKWKVMASDVSKEALEVARYNAEHNQVDIEFVCNDILDENAWNELPKKLDIIVSNPPYIPFEEKKHMSLNVLNWEPELALFAEPNSLLFYDKIADFAWLYLNQNGSLIFEINEFQAEATYSLIKEKGFSSVEILKDIFGKYRMLMAKK